ncbi:MAG: 2-amino-4-hydroxy-6-hydroxymethyldihydropteridine diphosphokinase [Moraxella sp.]|nr:2-amino-4-hydroxy-6-hydroxymethyldihydropteridine diphosphokinase [Moraxella sp.]
MINQYIIALGSNHDSEISFKIALDELKTWGDVMLSSVILGKDFTGKTELIYHNAVMMISLYEPMTYDDFNELLKNIESKCGRENHSILKFVPMDLDILAYCDDDWHIIKKRTPFKDHEKKGLNEIAPFLLA